MSSSTASEARTSAMPWRSILIAGAVAIVLSMIANQIVRAIAIRIVDVPDDFEPLATAGPVVVASISYGLVAIISYIVTRRFATNVRRAWLIVGIVGLVVSFIPPLGLAGQEDANTAAIAILLIMHVVAAAIIIPMMLRVGEGQGSSS